MLSSLSDAEKHRLSESVEHRFSGTRQVTSGPNAILFLPAPFESGDVEFSRKVFGSFPACSLHKS